MLPSSFAPSQSLSHALPIAPNSTVVSQSNRNTVLPEETETNIIYSQTTNTVNPQETSNPIAPNSTVISQSNHNTVLPEETQTNIVVSQTTNTVLPQATLTNNPAPDNSIPQNRQNNPAPKPLPQPSITVTTAQISHPQTLVQPQTICRSPHIAAMTNTHNSDRSLIATDKQNKIEAFLTEYAHVHETHCLLSVPLTCFTAQLSVDDALAALSSGDAEPLLDEDDDPAWATALASPDREYWIAGACDEIKSLEDLKVFVLIPRSAVPQNQRPLKEKLVCKRKHDDSGNVARHKVRYVAKGFAQRYLIDYEKTTAPTARLESFHSLLHITAVLDWDVQHIDVKTAFLHCVLPDNETVFIEQPPGFEVPGKEDWVMHLLKGLYRMKQAGRIWNQTFHKAVTALGFIQLSCEWCVYNRKTATSMTTFAVHVDDIISISSSTEENDLFKMQLHEYWEISDLSLIKFALGIAVALDRKQQSITLSQTSLIDQIVDQFGQHNAHHVDTPMVAGMQIVRPDKSVPISSGLASWIQRTPYRSLVSTLNYLAIATCPDVAFAVGRLATVLNCY